MFREMTGNIPRNIAMRNGRPWSASRREACGLEDFAYTLAYSRAMCSAEIVARNPGEFDGDPTQTTRNDLLESWRTRGAEARDALSMISPPRRGASGDRSPTKHGFEQH